MNLLRDEDYEAAWHVFIMSQPERGDMIAIREVCNLVEARTRRRIADELRGIPGRDE